MLAFVGAVEAGADCCVSVLEFVMGSVRDKDVHVVDCSNDPGTAAVERRLDPRLCDCGCSCGLTVEGEARRDHSHSKKLFLLGFFSFRYYVLGAQHRCLPQQKNAVVPLAVGGT